MKKMFLILAAAGMGSLSAQAGTTIIAVPGTPHTTPAIDTFQTSGDEMAGMEVKVSFATPGGPVVRTATWAALVAGVSGEAVDLGWFRMTESGDTFGGYSFTGPWQLHNLSTFNITGFELYGAPGSTTFDRSPTTLPEGTIGSNVGRDFDVFDNSVNSVLVATEYDVTATYSDILNLTALPAVGDEYVRLNVAFGPNTPVTPGTVLSFQQDTDNSAVRGTITRTPDLASTGLLVSLGLFGLGALRRRLA